MYIPGETRENDKIRKIFMESCGLVALLVMTAKIKITDIRLILIDFLENLELVDYEYQLLLLDCWKEKLL